MQPGNNMGDDIRWGMNEYEVTYVNGDVLEVEAWTPEIAEAIAEEEMDRNGRPLAVASVRLLSLGTEA